MDWKKIGAWQASWWDSFVWIRGRAGGGRAGIQLDNQGGKGMLVLSFQQDTRQGFTLCYMAADTVCQRQRRKGQDNEPYVTPRLGCLARPAHRAGVPLAAMGASPLTAAHAADTGPTCAVQRRI